MSHRLPRRLAGVLLIALLVAGATFAAGCGSGDTDSKNSYVDQMNRSQDRFAAAFERLASQITTSSTAAQDRRTLGEVQQALDSTVTDLQAMKPPDEVKQLHRQLTSEIASYGTAVEKAATAMATKDLAARAQATADLSKETTRTSADVNRTIGEINAKLHG